MVNTMALRQGKSRWNRPLSQIGKPAASLGNGTDKSRIRLERSHRIASNDQPGLDAAPPELDRDVDLNGVSTGVALCLSRLIARCVASIPKCTDAQRDLHPGRTHVDPLDQMVDDPNLLSRSPMGEPVDQARRTGQYALQAVGRCRNRLEQINQAALISQDFA